MFESVHGSAPDIAGTGDANPMAAVVTVALMLDHLGHGAAAQAVESAVQSALGDLKCTPDVGGELTTVQVGDHLAESVAAS